MTSKIAVVVVAVVAGGAAGWFASALRESRGHATPTPPPVERPPGDGGEEAPRLVGQGPTPPASAEAIAELQRTVARLQEAIAKGDHTLAVDPIQRKAEVLKQLKSIEYGDQQALVKKLVKELQAIGDPAVADLVALLAEGYEKDWGGGFSTGGGGVVKSYGRMRMVLIDALRQIGTRKSKEGLLSVIRDSGDLTDYRDLLLMYGSTTDPFMVEGISALVPGLLDKIAKVGVVVAEERASMINMVVVRWIRVHHLTDLTDAVASLVSASPDDHRTREYFGLVVGFDPERAMRLVREHHPDGLDGVSGSGLMNFRASGNVPLAKIARYLELLLEEFDLTNSQRMSLYLSIHPLLCRQIEDLEERAEDGKVLLAFLESRQAVEAESHAKTMLDRTVVQLRKEISKISGPR